MSQTPPQFDSNWILQNRGAKNIVDAKKPYAHLIEPERSPHGEIENVATIFLTNRECPFRCLMCDLWKNTTDYTVNAEDLVNQIEWAFNQFRSEVESPTNDNSTNSLQTLKLYNSGNFFDKKAIPEATLQNIQVIANSSEFGFQWKRLIIENHPKLVGDSCLKFARDLVPRLEVAMGLETIHPEILPSLNKQMTLDDFERACNLLNENDIDVRAFVLLKPPFLDDKEGVEWALRSIEWAYQIGVNCCAVIPTRLGNGSLEKLSDHHFFSEPKFNSMELLLREGLKIKQHHQRLFIDLWDSYRFAECPFCFESRRNRLNQINLQQESLPISTKCDHCNYPSVA